MNVCSIQTRHGTMTVEASSHTWLDMQKPEAIRKSSSIDEQKVVVFFSFSYNVADSLVIICILCPAIELCHEIFYNET